MYICTYIYICMYIYIYILYMYKKTFKSIEGLELFNLKGNTKRKNIFRESILLCFIKISISLKKPVLESVRKQLSVQTHFI